MRQQVRRSALRSFAPSADVALAAANTSLDTKDKSGSVGEPPSSLSSSPRPPRPRKTPEELLALELTDHPHLVDILTPEAFEKVTSFALNPPFPGSNMLVRARDALFPANPAESFEDLVRQLEDGGARDAVVKALKDRAELAQEQTGIPCDIAIRKSAREWIDWWDSTDPAADTDLIVMAGGYVRRAGRRPRREDPVEAPPPELTLKEFLAAADAAPGALYHGTTPDAAESIMQLGFLLHNFAAIRGDLGRVGMSYLSNQPRFAAAWAIMISVRCFILFTRIFILT
mgnify:CR=1 FL=1